MYPVLIDQFTKLLVLNTRKIAVDKMKQFILQNKELLMFLVGFGVMHIGWYNLQRNETLNKALAASREKELKKVGQIKIYRKITFYCCINIDMHSVQLFYFEIKKLKFDTF